MSEARSSPALERSLGVFSASTIIIGSMNGSGICIAPSIMAGFIATDAFLVTGFPAYALCMRRAPA